MVRLKGIQEKKKKDKDEAMILLQEGNEEAGNIEKHKDELQAKKRAIEKEIREAKVYINMVMWQSCDVNGVVRGGLVQLVA